MASAQLPPRKGAYAKHITALHKDQHFRVQAKNAQEIELLEDFHGYMKKRAAIEKQYSEALLKLTNTYQAHKIIPIPDIGNPASAQSRADDDSGLGSSLANPRTYNGNQPKEVKEANVYTVWRRLLDENEKIAKTRLAAVQVLVEDVEKESKVLRNLKQTQTKKCLEKLQVIQRDLQFSVSEVDAARQAYFEEESGASDVRDKAKEADEKAKGRKKDMASFFQSTKTLRRKAGNLSIKQEELDIKSTGARNDYILSLAAANAHQEHYFKNDLQDVIKTMESEVYEKLGDFLGTVAKTELQTSSAIQSSFSELKCVTDLICRGHNYRCYLKAYPSLAEHVTYQQEFVQGDTVTTITTSEHDGGYSLNYMARQNASKLNQAAKTIKAFNKRIAACHYHRSKGLKKEPNDTAGPDLATKIVELQTAIRNSEREKAKSEARLAKLREGGINVDDYIDPMVYAVETTPPDEQQVQGLSNDQNKRASESGESVDKDGSSSEKEIQFQETGPVDGPAPPENAGNWAESAGWDDAADDPPASQPGGGEGDDWATDWDRAKQDDDSAHPSRQISLDSNAPQKGPPAPSATGGTDWSTGNQWGSFDRQNSLSSNAHSSTHAQQLQQDWSLSGATPGAAEGASTGAVRAVALYSFSSQNTDELTVEENEEVSVLLGECDEEGWLMVMNKSGQKGYVPQNYLELEGVGGEAGATVDDVVAAQKQQMLNRQDSATSQGSWSYGYQPHSQLQMEPILEQADALPDAKGYPDLPSGNTMAKREASGNGLQEEEDEEDVEEDEDEYSMSSAATSSCPPPSLPPPPGPPPSISFQEGALKKENSGPVSNIRPTSVSNSFSKYASQSMSIDSSCTSGLLSDFCKALYDYEATGSDEISFEEGEIIKILKREPNGVDDGWWFGELCSGEDEGMRGLFPSIVVEECMENGDSLLDDEMSSVNSPPSMAPPSFSPPAGLTNSKTHPMDLPPQLTPPTVPPPPVPPPLCMPPPLPPQPIIGKPPPVPPPPLQKPRIQQPVDNTSIMLREDTSAAESDTDVITSDKQELIQDPESGSTCDSAVRSFEKQDQVNPCGNYEILMEKDQDKSKSSDYKEENSTVKVVPIAAPVLNLVLASPEREGYEFDEDDSASFISNPSPSKPLVCQIPTMEVVVIAPTPTIQSPTSEDSEEEVDEIKFNAVEAVESSFQKKDEHKSLNSENSNIQELIESEKKAEEHKKTTLKGPCPTNEQYDEAVGAAQSSNMSDSFDVLTENDGIAEFKQGEEATLVDKTPDEKKSIILDVHSSIEETTKDETNLERKPIKTEENKTLLSDLLSKRPKDIENGPEESSKVDARASVTSAAAANDSTMHQPDQQILFSQRKLERMSTSDSSASEFSLGPRASNIKQPEAVDPVVYLDSRMEDAESSSNLAAAKNEEECGAPVVSGEQFNPNPTANFAKTPPSSSNRDNQATHQVFMSEEESLKQNETDTTAKKTVTKSVSRASSSEDTDSEEQSSNKEIRRASSSSSESSSIKEDKGVRKKKTHRTRSKSSSSINSSSTSAGLVGEKDEKGSESSEGEVPQPPEELELKQLKKLEMMKESPA